ncbi:flagellar biosynthesis protein FlhF [Verminephrobacter aporrectodeae subsp. tuberculatae]|uniref:flagellar biosynthesis protein FlhF n=2 Tax=Verminephrobacter aporrectodeae TaxID=1110389 RepID=UPI00223750BE|nr:flagellar biosynthesis protein FlhF [Verminephrobacter aporrectodeae]MCW5221509.1 flagellar biosynthesis protein FlhF [Verminephrobacter aporrectodeae subsp. tuberculatae]MCW5290800.1 flagellar biosynthesis protein FlhF [Verminephrobacter aporrectodeae subsp. tuberculatae]
MNIQRFHAPTARQALAKARMAFGDGTLILSNRPTPEGVEVLATAEDTLGRFDGASAPSAQPAPPVLPVRNAPAPGPGRNPVEEDAERLSMSTLSFQDYVRERMLRRRHEASPEAGNGGQAPAAPRRGRGAPTPGADPAPAQRQNHAMHELQTMQALIEERLDTLAWLGQAGQNPIQSQLMLKLIRAGYSPGLARALLERMPPALAPAQAVRWIMQTLELNLRTEADAPALHERGGIFALTGSTGVGKTSSAAKLAALCARSHGAASVGLVTLDNCRAGAHEQLRAYGRTLGIVAHLAHDRAALQDLLGLLGGKKMVLIDTAGVAPCDPRRRELLDMLELPQVQRLLVLNAGCHGDTLDDMLGAFRSAGPQQAILSKVDEAVKLGPAIDACIRHQLVLRAVTRGQRGPEDWERADAQQLVGASMRAPARSAFDPKAADLGFFFAHSPASGHPEGQGHA